MGCTTVMLFQHAAQCITLLLWYAGGARAHHCRLEHHSGMWNLCNVGVWPLQLACAAQQHGSTSGLSSCALRSATTACCGFSNPPLLGSPHYCLLELSNTSKLAISHVLMLLACFFASKICWSGPLHLLLHSMTTGNNCGFA